VQSHDCRRGGSRRARSARRLERPKDPHLESEPLAQLANLDCGRCAVPLVQLGIPAEAKRSQGGTVRIRRGARGLDHGPQRGDQVARRVGGRSGFRCALRACRGHRDRRSARRPTERRCEPRGRPCPLDVRAGGSAPCELQEGSARPMSDRHKRAAGRERRTTAARRTPSCGPRRRRTSRRSVRRVPRLDSTLGLARLYPAK
jgi:hypothetical protein